MEQLALFSTPRTIRRRTKKKVSPAQMNSARWDLWTQETESEKHLALFFLDIRDFTPLTEKHNAFNVINIVRKLFSAFQNIIRLHHGRIIETSGDGFYAAFGLDRDPDEAVNAAVRAGYAILSTLEKLNSRSFEKNLQQRLEVGIGVHAGKVATGTLHLNAKDHFVVMGYAVNVASRIQAATKELGNNFIVSSAVFEALKSEPENSERVTANLKGVAEPSELYLIGKSYD